MARHSWSLLLGFSLTLGVSCSRPPAPRPSAIEISVPYEVDTLDPHARNRLSNFAIVSHFYEPLVTTDTNMSIHPCLATRWDNPDLVTWVFHLRPQVRFHSGKTLDADDVVYSFQRLLGKNDLGVAGYVLNIERVRALDPLTVEIKTSAPMSILLNKIRFVLIIPKGATTASLSRGVDGTGPYAFESWKPGVEIRMTRNEKTWGPRPTLSHVTVRLARSPEQALADLTAGHSDLVQLNSRSGGVAAGKLPGVIVKKQTSIYVKYLSYDQSHEVTPFCPGIPNPFRKKQVREAINLAIDRAALVARLSSDGVPAWQAVPPFIFGYNPAVREPRYQPDQARALLAQAGYPKGFTVTLHVRKIFEEAAAIVKEMLGKVGIRVTVSALPDAEYFAIVSEKKASFFLSRFGCPTGDVSDILDGAIHTFDPGRH
ncbi:MAG: ABC transporter substrate-binding protein, partial [Thermoanaerobaculia bacterium]